ncbi:hypothetical protein DFH06DRAFT_1138123 [Mycena polygramma]|nr:hypothetical protein DFH06DRAFT_1138123 [Mycena polygramma]
MTIRYMIREHLPTAVSSLLLDVQPHRSCPRPRRRRRRRRPAPWTSPPPIPAHCHHRPRTYLPEVADASHVTMFNVELPHPSHGFQSHIPSAARRGAPEILIQYSEAPRASHRHVPCPSDSKHTWFKIRIQSSKFPRGVSHIILIIYAFVTCLSSPPHPSKAVGRATATPNSDLIFGVPASGMTRRYASGASMLHAQDRALTQRLYLRVGTRLGAVGVKNIWT